MSDTVERIDAALREGQGHVEICEKLLIPPCDDVFFLIDCRRKALKEAGVVLCSPFGMVQERVPKNELYPWRIIVVAALMNRTHARQVRPILKPLFMTYPKPRDMSVASAELEKLIKPLGFSNRRSKALREMSADYHNGIVPSLCRGVGDFGRDCIAVFVEGRTNLRPKDGYLAKYIEWRLMGEP